MLDNISRSWSTGRSFGGIGMRSFGAPTNAQFIDARMKTSPGGMDRPFRGMSAPMLDYVESLTFKPNQAWHQPDLSSLIGATIGGNQGHMGRAAVWMNPFLNPGRRAQYEQMSQAMTAPLTSGNLIARQPRGSQWAEAMRAKLQAAVLARQARERAMERQYWAGPKVEFNPGIRPSAGWIYGENAPPWSIY